MLCFYQKVYYIRTVTIAGFFLLTILFNKVANSDNWINPVVLTQGEPPFYFEKNKMEKYCECGCGRIVKLNNRFINGHNSSSSRFKVGHIVSIETRAKLSFSRKGKSSGAKGKHWSKERRIKIIKALTGKHCSEETKRKIKIANTGKKHTEETKKKIGLSSKGRGFGIPRTEEVKKRISISSKGKVLSEECKRKISIANKGKKCSKETKRKLSKIHKELYLSGKFKPVLPKKYSNTSIEILMENELKKKGFDYEKQKHIKGVGFVDFFLPDFNIIIECDGDYWHNKSGAQNKDANRDFAASFFHKYKTFRFWEHEIKESPEKCTKEIFG